MRSTLKTFVAPFALLLALHSAAVLYANKRADVTCDPESTNPQPIAAAIPDTMPYGVTAVAGNTSPPRPAASCSSSCAAAEAPAGKPVVLAAFRANELRDQFNRASDRVRFVALLSPTCGQCRNGQRVVQSVFTKFTDPRLRGFVVWLPMLPSDDEHAAQLQAGAFTDGRVTQRWDGSRSAGSLLARTLALNSTAWDVYLLYAPGVKWTGEAPPQPTFWMHQLKAATGADQRVCLNPSVITAKVDALLHKRKT